LFLLVFRLSFIVTIIVVIVVVVIISRVRMLRSILVLIITRSLLLMLLRLLRLLRLVGEFLGSYLLLSRNRGLLGSISFIHTRLNSILFFSGYYRYRYSSYITSNYCCCINRGFSNSSGNGCNRDGGYDLL